MNELVKARRCYNQNRELAASCAKCAQGLLTMANNAPALSGLQPIINGDTITREDAMKMLHRAFSRTRAAINRLEAATHEQPEATATRTR